MGIVLFLAIAAAVPQAADTTVEIRRGDRVLIENLSGEVTISPWERDAVGLFGASDARGATLSRSGTTVRVTARDGRRRGRSRSTSLRVPSWVGVEVGSPSLAVVVRGMGGAITVGNVNGDVSIEDVDGAVDVRSINGEIRITDARGDVRASSQSDDVTLTRIAGRTEAHSGDGDIVLREMRSASVRAEARDGDIDFSGDITRGGDYAFFLHDGDATIAVPEAASARVSVSTFDGEFLSDFTVRVDRFTSGRQFEFVLGDGSARIEIEVFDGDIRLRQRR